MWGAGGSLKVTILQSSNSRAFSTVSLAPVSRPGDSASATPAAPGTPSKQALQFFCYICKASCTSQQVLRAGPAGEPGGQEGLGSPWPALSAAASGSALGSPAMPRAAGPQLVSIS